MRLAFAHVPWLVLAFAVLTATRPAAAVIESSGPDWVELDNGVVSLRFDLGSGTFGVDAFGVALGPFAVASQLSTAALTLPGDAPPSWRTTDIADALGTGKSMTITGVSSGHGIEVALTVRDGRAEVTGTVTIVPASLDTVTSFTVSAPTTAAAALGSDLQVLSEAHHSWLIPGLAARESSATGEGWSALYAPEHDLSWVLGALTQRELVTVSLRASLDITLNGPRAPVAAATPTTSDVFSIHVARGQNAALEDHADATAQIAGVSLPSQPMWGWVSWYSVFPANEGMIAIAANGLAAIDAGRGSGLVLVDDSWQNNIGDWQANTTFPSGMPALADAIHAVGLQAGLWLTPFGASAASAVSSDHPEWLVETSPGVPQVVENLPNAGGAIYRLDPSVVGVTTHLANLISTITNVWGYDLVKVDFMAWGLVEDTLARPGTDPRAAFRAALDAMRSAARPGTRFLLCGMPLAYAATRGEQVRTGPDANTDSGRHRSAYRSTARRAHQNGAQYHADGDVLMVRSTLDDGLARQRATFMTMAGGPVFLGDAFWWETPARQALQERLIPPHRRRGRPLDVFTSDLPGLWQLDAGPVQLNAGLTFDEVTEERLLNTATSAAPRFVFDVWSDRALGWSAAPIAVAVAGSDAALLTSAVVTNRPVVLATDAHLVGADVQVEASTWLPPHFNINLRGKPQSTLRVILAAPPTLAATSANIGTLSPRSDGLVDYSVGLDAAGVAAASLTFTTVTGPPAPPLGRPTLSPPAGVRVVDEDQVQSDVDWIELLDDAATGTLIVVQAPSSNAPAPAASTLPWAELLHPGTATSTAAGSLAHELATELGLPLQDESGALLNLRAGSEPARMFDGSTVTRVTHAVIVHGAGGIIRFGRVDDTVIQSAIARLADPAARARVHGVLVAASQFLALQRDAMTLDGAWRFKTDAGDVGATSGWAAAEFDDSSWSTIAVPSWWETAGHPSYDGVAWYRRDAFVPRFWSGLDLILEIDAADDEDFSYFEGAPIGDTHSWITPRRYPIAATDVSSGRHHSIAIRVIDNGHSGGIFRSVRLSPAPAALAARIGGGDLLGFVDADTLQGDPSDGTLLAVRAGDQVLLTVRGGRRPISYLRGDFPRATNPTTLTGGPIDQRTLVDEQVPGGAAYRVSQ